MIAWTTTFVYDGRLYKDSHVLLKRCVFVREDHFPLSTFYPSLDWDGARESNGGSAQQAELVY